ncbi:MAG: dihydroxy-acid dehydratase [Opitutaceae bacterium]|nr:dihydroxy-acid dehydratase [Verrucomicrobiales bacterium]
MKAPLPLRSQAWFGRKGLHGFLYRSWVQNRGIPFDQFDGRPVVGICNTWSELTPCNSHFRGIAEQVRTGILEAGGFPLEFPVMSLGETLMRPTAMMFRNLASMDVEETIRANPLDGVVLLFGCDKTTPALLMGAASVDLPTIGVSGGPMLRGIYRGTPIGSGTNTWAMSEAVRAGKLSEQEFAEAESCMHRSHGHCMTMGTASTMACMVEALGVGLPGNAAIPAVDARRNVLARVAGRRAVSMVRENLVLSKILTRAAFENAIRTNAAIGGSTNAVIHLLALAGRVQLPLTLQDWDRLGAGIPSLVNLMPSGAFLMEDFHEAGGLPVVLRALGENGLLRKNALTANGRTIWQNVRAVRCWRTNVISPFGRPFKRDAGIAVLRGNICPNGAIIKTSAASRRLMKHTGPAVVFESIEDFHLRINDPKLEIDENSVMVLKNCGPRGYPGMAEVGNMPLPPKLLRKGITDMVRISDARMSGTAFGTIVLHVAPEAALGGTFALIQNGDTVRLDVRKRSLNAEISEAELLRRRADWKPPAAHSERGYCKLYTECVQQADQGADLNFLVGRSGSGVARDNH